MGRSVSLREQLQGLKVLGTFDVNAAIIFSYKHTFSLQCEDPFIQNRFLSLKCLTLVKFDCELIVSIKFLTPVNHRLRMNVLLPYLKGHFN